MVDLGLFNFVKRAVSEGQSKENIAATLAKGGWTPANIDEAYTAVINNTPPARERRGEEGVVLLPAEPAKITDREFRPAVVSALCGFYSINFILIVLDLAFKSLSGKFPLSIDAALSPSVAISIISVLGIFGYWKMKRWGVLVFTLNTVALILSIAFQVQNLTLLPIVSLVTQDLLLPLFTVYIGFEYFEEMT
ncbi:hypothetical protein KGM48_02125 [Patescibacteria group bacterium]|nr:hypothetical protein [Patescibacteria group bacterium]